MYFSKLIFLLFAALPLTLTLNFRIKSIAGKLKKLSYATITAATLIAHSSAVLASPSGSRMGGSSFSSSRSTTSSRSSSGSRSSSSSRSRSSSSSSRRPSSSPRSSSSSRSSSSYSSPSSSKSRSSVTSRPSPGSRSSTSASGPSSGSSSFSSSPLSTSSSSVFSSPSSRTSTSSVSSRNRRTKSRSSSSVSSSSSESVFDEINLSLLQKWAMFYIIVEILFGLPTLPIILTPIFLLPRVPNILFSIMLVSLKSLNDLRKEYLSKRDKYEKVIKSDNLKHFGSVVKVQVSLMSDWSDPDSVMNTLAQSFTEKKEFADQPMLGKTLVEVCLLLLRKKNEWTAAHVYKNEYRGYFFDEFESSFLKLTVQERSKFEKEIAPTFSKTNISVLTPVVVTLLLAVEDSTELDILKGGVPSITISNIYDVLTALTVVGLKEKGARVSGFEVLWTPSERDSVLTEKDLRSDYPELIEF